MFVSPKRFCRRATLSFSETGFPRGSGAAESRPSCQTYSPGIAALFLTPLLLAGCANPGPPKPPSLHLPRPAENLTAVRTGDKVTVGWTTSNQTTDSGNVSLPIMAVLCHDDAPKPPPATPKYPIPPNPCRTIDRFVVSPGASSATETLPPPLTRGAPSLIAYRVELQNPRGHSAGWSAPVYAAAGAAPAPIGTITVAARRNAALITWQPHNAPADLPPAPVEINRTLLATAAGPVEPPQPRGSRPGKSAAPAPKSSSMNAADRATLQQAVLRVDSAANPRVDPGGLYDGSIRDGDTLTYTAQRVRTVQFTTPDASYTSKEGKSHESKSATITLEIRGEPSPPVTFTFRDVQPPAAPTGLAAIAGGGFGEPPSVDLSWDPNPELDLLGYDVFRAEGDAKPIRLNALPTPGPAYRDPTAQPGHTYRYFVTAIDQRHNESAGSPSVSVALRK
jgi:hypothetical protein